MLQSGAVVVADNVLKPGAPLYLWRVTHCRDFKTWIVNVLEFAMPAEDWMTVSFYRPDANSHDNDSGDGVPPQQLRKLEHEAESMRIRASSPGAGGADFGTWAEKAMKMWHALAELDL